MMANAQNITLEINGHLPARPDMLRTGDPCPCCGQPIKTMDPVLLRLLTLIRDEMKPHPESVSGVNRDV